MPLIDRRKHPPGGFQFYQPQTNWRPSGYGDFTATVSEIIQHRKSNPQFNLPLDRAEVEKELDDYTCARLKPIPSFAVWCDEKKKATAPIFTIPTPIPVARADAPLVVKGEEDKNTLAEWVGSGLSVVASVLAESRAATCSKCPKNVKGDFFDWITGQAAKAIKVAVSLKNRLNLKTSKDDQLGTCDACGCHLKLKVWVPDKTILAGLDSETRAQLHPSCWILKL